MKTRPDVVMEVMVAHFPGYKHSHHYRSMMGLATKIIEALDEHDRKQRERIPMVPAEPGLQMAFIEESRAALGHPDAGQAAAWLGHSVRIAFNHTTETRWGVVTAIRGAPAARYLILDNDETDPVYLRSVESLSSG
jgi:hypothetical protein